jgi:hypothetical protein
VEGESLHSKVLVDEDKIVKTIQDLPANAFTVLDFIDMFKRLFPEDWSALVERLGVYGGKRRYTVSTYFSNRLDVYSHKPDSLLMPFARYKMAKFKDYRRTSVKEREVFGSPWIAVFKKKA